MSWSARVLFWGALLAGTCFLVVNLAGCGGASGAAQQPPSFTLSANPTALSVAQGSNGTSTITVNGQNGFTGSVSLAASGLPSGVTASFNPTATTTTSTLTLTASNSATTGAATVTITGTSGSLTATTTVSLTVTLVGACNGGGPPAYSCTAANNAALPDGPLAVVNYPSPIPSMGNLTGAGTVKNDPDFGNPIVRCTDANTDPNSPNITFDTNGGGAGMVNHFNTDDTILYVQEHGGLGVPLLFDANTMQCSRMYPDNSAYSSTGGLTIQGIGADFSYNNPNWLYVWDSVGGMAQIFRYDFSDRSLNGTPTVTLIADFIADTGLGFTGTPGNCLPASFNQNVVFTGHDGPGNDDIDNQHGTFTATYSLGIQNTGYYVVAWKVGSGCRVYNTAAGTVSGDWGPAGPVKVFAGNSNTPDSPTDEFYVHSIFVNLTGDYALIGNGGCVAGNSSCNDTLGQGPYFWQIDSANVWKLANNSGGEFAFGWNDFINRDNSPQGDYAIRRFTALGSPNQVINPNNLPPHMVAGLAGHPSWVNDNSTDSLPFFDSLIYPLYYNTSFPSAWTNEIIGVFPADGSTLRFAHTFASKSNAQFSTDYGIGSISQSGKFFMQSSDWVGTLGSTSGEPKCLWGYDWASETYPANFQYLSPPSNEGNGGGYVYQATSCNGACTSGSTEPATWNQTVGGTTTDGTITWTNKGPQNCRGDVFIVKLQ